MARYQVTTFDCCAPGFERLRSPSEFILLAYPSMRSGWKTLRDEWIADIDASSREDGFDYDAARRCVESFCGKLRRDWKGRRNPMGLEPKPREDDDCGEAVTAFLYVRDTWCDMEPPVNLDSCHAGELRDFIADYRRAGRIGAAKLFPEKPAGYQAACFDLVRYAERKREAMDCRATGRIDMAMTLEKICDAIHAGLPPYARW